MSAAPSTSPKRASRLGRALRRARALKGARDIGLVALASLLGVASALGVSLMTRAAMAMHVWIYDLPFDLRLSAADHVTPLAAFSALMLAGLALGLMEAWRRAKNIAGPVDPVEANALRGGMMNLRDSFVVSAQTLLSNGVGASVGLEAGYAQFGAGVASALGQRLNLRRGDLRLLVAAGAAGAISSAFGAPLTGAFYGFEIVLGSYSIAAAPPIFGAAIVSVLTTRALIGAPYQIETPAVGPLSAAGFPALFALAAAAVAIGVVAMRLAAGLEKAIAATKTPVWARPVLGGAAVAALATITPQVLGAGHGALALNISSAFPLQLLAAFMALKLCASLISLASGFRGGLFFASLYLGASLGKIFGVLLSSVLPALAPDPTVLILAGMACFGVVIVGGPLTMAFLVLENTAEYSVSAGVIAAAIAASLMVRASFGYSFSTWRLHLRGENVRGASDVGWADELKISGLMRKDFVTAPDWLDLDAFCEKFSGRDASTVILVDSAGRYAGLASLAEVLVKAREREGRISDLARQKNVWLAPQMNARSALALFDESEAEQLVVLDPENLRPLGLVSENFVARRYAEKADAAYRSAFGM